MSKLKRIKSLLIANRGEIACRIIHTAKKLNIKTVAIYSEIDTHAKHVKMSDEEIAIGKNSPRESYLNIDAIIQAAKKAKVDAIHPGYGFLAENAAFAKGCENANIIFVGPSSNAISAMGSKLQAKNLMISANVPTIPGFSGPIQDVDSLVIEARKIGLPVLLKASSGGGGKGMRIVQEEVNLKDAILSAKRESQNSFGDDTLIIEKYLPNARHIEVQIFGDSHGNYVHLFDRDCSMQRRHQKIIEEAPAMHIPAPVREKMYTCAISAARAIHYSNAGTIEFLLTEDNQFYFMEMNTRLQVEHPVTELITGIDLVEWQLRIADGETLPLTQNEIKQNGHAIEARIYAEDPLHEFLPITGTIEALTLPQNAVSFTNGSIRFDSGIQEKDAISIYYDPLIAKLIAYDKDRVSAFSILNKALKDTSLIGLKNNIPFLRALTEYPQVVQNDAHLSSSWLSQNLKWVLDAMSQSNLPIQSMVRMNHTWHETQTPRFLNDGLFRTGQNQTGNSIYSSTDHSSSFETAMEHHPLAVISPMPGIITHIYVKVGSKVNKGEKLMAVEAMKMEHVITAHKAGTIQSIHFKQGESVQEGTDLMELN